MNGGERRGRVVMSSRKRNRRSAVRSVAAWCCSCISGGNAAERIPAGGGGGDVAVSYSRCEEVVVSGFEHASALMNPALPVATPTLFSTLTLNIEAHDQSCR